jgi:hypothetical protein
MKMHKSILLSTLVLLFMASYVMVVYAPIESLNSGYAVDSNWHGTDVPIGMEVTVTAYTTDPDVTQVTFKWRDDNEALQCTSVDNVRKTDGTYNSLPVYYFESKYTPDSLGDWGVQALFEGADGKPRQDLTDVVAIKATSFNAIPEIAILGTVGASTAMLLGLAFKMKRKAHR